jgi:hypothetical protein
MCELIIYNRRRNISVNNVLFYYNPNSSAHATNWCLYINPSTAEFIYDIQKNPMGWTTGILQAGRGNAAPVFLVLSQNSTTLITNGIGTTKLPCSAEFISTVYQPWNSIFLSQQNSHSRLISRRNSLPNRA